MYIGSAFCSFLYVVDGVMPFEVCLQEVSLTLSSKTAVVRWPKAYHLPSPPGVQWCDGVRSVPVTYPLFQVVSGVIALGPYLSLTLSFRCSVV